MFTRQADRFFETAHALGLNDDLDGRSVVAADLDNDGDLDLVMRNLKEKPFQIWENTFTTNAHYVDIYPVYSKGGRSPIGARLDLTCGGATQVRQITAGNSFLSQSPQHAYFGLGGCAGPVEVAIAWPDGAKEIHRDLPVDMKMRLIKGEKGPVPF